MILQPPLTLRFPAGRVSFGPLSAPRRPFGARRLLQTATKETGPVPAKTHGSILSESRKKRQTLAKRTQPLEPLSPEAPNYLYPERLLIYNSGTFRTTFLSIIKVTTIFSFLGSLWVNAWPQLVILDGSVFEAMRIAAISAVPPIVVHLFTHPYIATINLHLPRRARVSLSSLKEFSKELQPTTKLSITTVRPWGSSKAWELTVGDLEKVEPRVGRIENYVTKHGKEAFIGLGHRFYVGDVVKGEKNARVPGIWKQVSKVIENGPAHRKEADEL